MKLSEEGFPKKVMNGDTQALRILRKQALKGIKNFLFAKGDRSQDPEDLMHDAYFILLENLHAEKYTANNLVGYYIGIAKMLWRTSHKKKIPFKDYLPEQLTNLSEDEIPMYEHTRIWMTYGELEEGFKQIFSKLDEECKKLLTWRKVENKKSVEIAAMLENLKHSSVDKTVNRCKTKLTNMLLAAPNFPFN